MALDLNAEYTNTEGSTTSYPQGSFKNETSPGSLDGTPFEKAWPDDIYGYLQRLIKDAGITVSGAKDTVLVSEYFNAAAMVFEESIVCDASGADTIVLTTVSGATKANLIDGQLIVFKVAADNTGGAATINIDGTGVQSVTLKDGTAIPERTFKVGQYATVVWSLGDTRWEVRQAQDDFFVDKTNRAVYLGYLAGQSVAASEFDNVLIGQEAGRSFTTGDGNIMIGVNAGETTTGDINDNILIGFTAGQSIVSSNFLVCIGRDAGKVLSADTGSIMIGASSGSANVGSENVFIGYQAGQVSTGADGNTLIGYQTGKALTTGDENVFIGSLAGGLQTTASQNVAIGYQAGFAQISSDGNVYVGADAGLTHTGDACTFIGPGAGVGQVSSDFCTFVGGLAGGGVSATGNSNTGVGEQTLASLTLGLQNTAMGRFAGNNVSIGDTNVLIGYSAGITIVGGDNNVAVGPSALASAIGASDNTCIGRQAGQNVTTSGNVLIGANVVNNEALTGGNKFAIANANWTFGSVHATDANLLEGNFSTGEFFLPTTNGEVVTSGIALLIDTSTGQLGTTTSSRRYKTNINNMRHGQSDFIYDSEIVTFNFKKREMQDGKEMWSDTEHEPKMCHGMIAEDFIDIMPDMVMVNEDGEPQGIDYTAMIPAMIHKLQEQRGVIHDLALRLDNIEEKI